MSIDILPLISKFNCISKGFFWSKNIVLHKGYLPLSEGSIRIIPVKSVKVRWFAVVFPFSVGWHSIPVVDDLSVGVNIKCKSKIRFNISFGSEDGTSTDSVSLLKDDNDAVAKEFDIKLSSSVKEINTIKIDGEAFETNEFVLQNIILKSRYIKEIYVSSMSWKGVGSTLLSITHE